MPDSNMDDDGTAEGKPNWPNHVRSVTREGLDNIGVDREGDLYWRGKQAGSTRKFRLTRNQRIGAGIAIGASAVQALIDLLRFLGIGH
jgi:hypothetical protein